MRLVIMAGIMATAACSGSSTSASMTPSGPSSTASVTAQSFSSTVPTATTQFTGHVETERHDDQDQLEGVIASIDTGAHTLMVSQTTVTVPATAVIRHGHTTLAFTDLKVGDRVHVKGTKSGATLVASEVNLQQPDHVDSGQEDNDVDGARARGAVANLHGACPAVTFTLGNITVTTSATTTFRNGSCSQLVAGVQITAKGTAQPDGSIQAASVAFPGESDDHESDD